MEQVAGSFMQQYMPVGDLSVVTLCFVIIILLSTSFVTRTRSFRIFLSIVCLLIFSALSNVAFQLLSMQRDPALVTPVYILRTVYHISLFSIFFLFSFYIAEVTRLEARKRKITLTVSGLLFIGICLADIISAVSTRSFRVIETGQVQAQGGMLFAIGWALNVVLLIIMLAGVRNMLYRRVMLGFYATVALSLLIQVIQRTHGQSSFTVMTFLYPVISMFYIMHSNPYNVALGAVDNRGMEDYIRNMHGRKAPFIFLSLYLPDFDSEGKMLTEELQSVTRRLAANSLRGCVLFQIGNGHMILIAPKRRNADYEHRIQTVLKGLRSQQEFSAYEYKIVIGENIDSISERNEYASLIQDIHRHMEPNTVHRVSPDDIIRFDRNEYILQELADIHARKDPEDPRVLTFCQPVFNITTGEFDTAEALMRLDLPETGMVFPDQFIPIAEQYGFIHTLTEIILHKTCAEIRKLINEGYRITRISVNVSVMELKEDSFCSDINETIDRNHVPGEKIAIELTESRSEADFMLMKAKIEELHQKGIKLYLDDFGTGYSNMERIMELPFDIIKFDRSMVVASGENQRSEHIVEKLANIFSDLHYSVLYEGVEDELDEERCREMYASYLQGYKYSRPVPIENLRDFLKKSA